MVYVCKKLIQSTFKKVQDLKKYIFQKPAEFGTIISTIVAVYALYISIESVDNANIQFEKNSKSADSLFNVQLTANAALNDSLIFDNRRLFKMNAKLSDSLYYAQFKNEKELNKELISEVKSLQIITDSLRRLTQKTLEYSVYAERPVLSFFNAKITDNDTIKIEKKFKGNIRIQMQNSGKRTANKVFVRCILFSKLYLILNIDTNNKTYFNMENGSSKQYSLPVNISLDDLQNFYFLIEATYVDEKLPDKRSKVDAYHYFKPINGIYDFSLSDEIDKNYLIKIANKRLKENKIEIFQEELN